jgi:molybdopterin biosynthesis enzyme
MRLTTLPIETAVGGILVHNVADAEGHKALAKGHRLTADDIEKLRALGKHEVYVGVLNADDVRENDAVARIAQAVAGENTSVTAPGGGRVNLLATTRGLLKLNASALLKVNSIEGVTLATIPANTVVEAKKMVATLKTIGLAMPESILQEVESIARDSGSVVWVRPMPSTHVAVILTGSPEARGRVEQRFAEPIQTRVEELGGQVISRDYVPEASEAIAQCITRAVESGADLVIMAGETSIMDADDISPRGIKAAGGAIEIFGAPVEPGNLLLLAYCGHVPVVGAPGCVQSRDTNVVDLILPRLMAGEKVSRAEVIALANGGLLL